MIWGFPVGDTYKGIALGESLQGDSLSGVPIKRIFLGESLRESPKVLPRDFYQIFTRFYPISQGSSLGKPTFPQGFEHFEWFWVEMHAACSRALLHPPPISPELSCTPSPICDAKMACSMSCTRVQERQTPGRSEVRIGELLLLRQARHAFKITENCVFVWF